MSLFARDLLGRYYRCHHSPAGGQDMTAEIVDLGQYREWKQRHLHQEPEVSNDPPPQDAQAIEPSSQDDEMG